MSFVAINVAVRLQGSELDQEEAGRWFSSGPSGHVRNTTRLWLAAWGKVATQTFIEQKLLLSLSLPLRLSFRLWVCLSNSVFVSLLLCLLSASVLSLCLCACIPVCVLVSLPLCISRVMASVTICSFLRFSVHSLFNFPLVLPYVKYIHYISVFVSFSLDLPLCPSP